MFEEFTSKGRMSATEPLCRINKSGIITFNTPAADKHFPGAVCVRLYFDKDSNMIGLRTEIEPVESAYKLVKLSRTNAVQVSAKGFFKFYAIDLASMKKRKFKPFLDSEGMIIINLKEGV